MPKQTTYLEFSNGRISMAKKLVVNVDYSGDISDATTESSNQHNGPTLR